MAFSMKSQQELIQLLNAGASFTYDGKLKSQHELALLAAAAKNGGGQLTLTAASYNQKSHQELVQLATAGKGHLIFAD